MPIDQSLILSERVSISNHSIQIESNKMPVFIAVVLFGLAIISILIPLLVLIFLVYSKSGFHFGIVLSFALFWGSAFLITKNLLWNIYGVEILHFSENQIIYQPDFKYFKGTPQRLPLQHLDFEIDVLEPKKTDSSIIHFISEEESISTCFKIPVNDCEIIVKIIQERAKQNFL
jgi:predicted membrane protein